MIRIIESPQRSDTKMSYEKNGDILIVTVNGVTEEFDFTGLPEGTADEIKQEILDINPIIAAEKTGDVITITLIRFYGAQEKEVFESGENQMET